MARTETTQTGFTAGEWSPRTLGNTDSPRFLKACESLENWIVLLQGGAISRWGTRFTAEAKDSATASRLIPFRYSNSQAYVIEMGHLYLRFYTQNSRIESPPGTPVEATAPWSAAQIWDVEFAQYGDTAILVHPDKVPYRLVRISSTQWKLQAAPFVVWPSAESGLQPATTATLSAASGAITITAGAAAFLASDVGRQVIADIGEATITGYTSTTQVNATATGFQATAYAAGEWTITESPKTTLTLTALTNKRNGAATLTLGAAGWRSTDVGSYVLCKDGVIEIIAYSSDTVVTGRVREVLSSDTTVGEVVASAAWSLEPRTWSASRGYPRAVALSEQRFIFGGTYAEPVAIWASVVGQYYDLSRGVRAASGFALRFFGHDMSTIMHLVQAPTTLHALTASAEMSAGTGSDDAMTATNVHPRIGSTNGASAVRPQLVNNDLWFAQDGGTKVRALACTQQENALWSPDVTWEAEHLFREGVVQLVFCKDPHPVVYAVLGDGRLAACAVYRQAGTLEHEVLAWSPISTDGYIESAAVMRNGAEDQLWLIVRRDINGTSKRYIERADWTLQTDCALTGSSGVATASWAGFDHLEGKTVQVKGDDCELANQVVVAGIIGTKLASTGTDRPSLTVEAGLPFLSTMTIPDIEMPGSSFAGARVHVHEVIAEVVDTIGLEIQGADLKWRPFGADAFTSPPTAYTGKKRVPNLGWNGGRVTIRRTHPYTAYIRRVTRRFSVNE